MSDLPATLIDAPIGEVRRVGGGDICDAWLVQLTDGSRLFAKSRADVVTDLFASEAASLRWLAESATAAVPAVHAVDQRGLVLEWLDEAPPSAQAAEDFGRALAALHASGASGFGAPWPGFAGRLRFENVSARSWAEFFASTRLRPLLRAAQDQDALDAGGAAAVSTVIDRLADLAGPIEPPARLHGDLWGGNLLWTSSAVYLIDPAAYGGHRETDIAMLHLFGAPNLDVIMAAYQEATPLADGWQERLGLQQLYPLLAHTVMFGGGYGNQAVSVARRYV